MTNNKKFSLIFVIFVLLPIGFAFLNYYLADFNKFRWGYNNVNQVSFSALLIGILACAFIIYKNYSSKLNNKFWYIIASLFGFIYLVYFYFIYSLSHFGF